MGSLAKVGCVVPTNITDWKLLQTQSFHISSVSADWFVENKSHTPS
jgi:hypothetical protein